MKRSSNIQCYPFPRDIISRTLANMGKGILPVLAEVLKTNNIIAIREVIDAIGCICFYDNTDYTEIFNRLF